MCSKNREFTVLKFITSWTLHFYRNTRAWLAKSAIPISGMIQSMNMHYMSTSLYFQTSISRTVLIKVPNFMHPNRKEKHFTIGNMNLIHFWGPMAVIANARSIYHHKWIHGQESGLSTLTTCGGRESIHVIFDFSNDPIRFSVDSKLNIYKRNNPIYLPGAAHADEHCYVFR